MRVSNGEGAKAHLVGGGQPRCDMETDAIGYSRAWEALAHLAAFIPMPFGGIVGPILVRVISTRHPEVVKEAKNALNFQISAQLYYVALMVTFGFGLTASVWLSGHMMQWVSRHTVGIALGIIAYSIAWKLAWAGIIILAVVRTTMGRSFRYPLSIRFVR